MNTIALTQPRRLEFGNGCLASLVEYLGTFPSGTRAFVVTSPAVEARIAETVEQGLGPRSAVRIDASTRAEPTVAHFEAVLRNARDFRPDLVIASGGGSPLDAGKLVAALLHSRQSVHDVFGIGLLTDRATPLVCVPTTAGTGSEVSPNAILLDEAEQLKRGVISPFLVPDATFFDPLLTTTVPPAITAATGLDALTHCIEVFANRFAHPVTDLYAIEGVRLIGAHIERAVHTGDDADARSAVALGSLYGGLGLGPVNTAAVHALAYPLGSRYGTAHGVSNAVLLPHVIAFNLEAAPTRYAQIALALGVAPSSSELETARRGVERLRELCTACGIPASLAELGVPADAVAELVASALTVQRLLKNNLCEVTEPDAHAIYEAAFEAVPAR